MSPQNSRSYWVSGMAIFSRSVFCRVTPCRIFEFFGVDVEAFDVVEDAFGIIDDAAGGRGIPVLRRESGDATTHIADQFVQFGEFGGGGQVTSLG